MWHGSSESSKADTSICLTCSSVQPIITWDAVYTSYLVHLPRTDVYSFFFKYTKSVFGFASCLRYGRGAEFFLFLSQARVLSNSNCCLTLRRIHCAIKGFALAETIIISAQEVDVSSCHGSVAMRTVNIVRKFQDLESFDVALLSENVLGMITDQGVHFLPSSGKSSCINSCFFDECLLSCEKLAPVVFDLDRHLLENHRAFGQSLD